MAENRGGEGGDLNVGSIILEVLVSSVLVSFTTQVISFAAPSLLLTTLGLAVKSSLSLLVATSLLIRTPHTSRCHPAPGATSLLLLLLPPLALSCSQLRK